MKYSKKQKQLQKERQKMYVNQWNVSEGLKFYDALEDTFATYYFANPTVKKHLKHLEKVVKKQPKTSEVLRVTFLLQSRFKKNSPQQQQRNNGAENSIDDLVIKPYQKDLKPQSLQRLRKINKHENTEQAQKNDQKINRAESFDDRLPQLSKNKVYRSRNELAQAKPAKKKFLAQYLEKKKQQLQKFKQ